MKTEKILVVDDHDFSRNGVVNSIKKYFGESITIIEAKSGSEAIRLFEQFNPKMVFLDIEIPELNGLEVCKYIQSKKNNTKVIFVTMHTDITILTAIKKSKANAYISKSDSYDSIYKCLDFITKKNSFYSSSEFPLNEINNNIEYKRLYLLIEDLTNTEKKVLKYLLLGKSNDEIRMILFVTPKSLHNYRNRICRKLNLPSQKNTLTHWIFKNKESLKILFNLN